MHITWPTPMTSKKLPEHDYLNVKSSPMKYSSDEIRELQQLVAGMKKEIKELKGEVRDYFF